MIKIEVFPGDDHVQQRMAGTRTFYFQRAYLHRTGERFPLAFELPMKADAQAFPVGLYTLAPESLLINQYKALEMSRFRVQLNPLTIKEEKSK